MGEWNNGICSCFGDFTLCIVTFILPCYTAGKLGENVPGCSCLKAGLLFAIPVVNIVIHYMLRKGIKTVKLVDEGTPGTLFYVICCPLCALVQEAREMGVSLAMARE